MGRNWSQTEEVEETGHLNAGRTQDQATQNRVTGKISGKSLQSGLLTNVLVSNLGALLFGC